MKRFLTLVLLFCLLINGLFAQEKMDNPIQPYFALMTGYATIPVGNAISINSEYQYRYKKNRYWCRIGY